MARPPAEIWLVLLLCCTSAGTPIKFDCVAGYKNWKMGWSSDKKAWCCRNQNRGCLSTTEHSPAPSSSSRGAIPFVPASTLPPQPLPAQPAPAPEHDCVEGYATWERTWSKEKKDWCCFHTQHGCAATVTTTATSATTQSTLTTAVTSTSVTRTATTTTTTTSTTFNCAVAEQLGSWTNHQMNLCCLKEHKGCKPKTTPEPYDCKVNAKDDVVRGTSQWPLQQKVWCCRTKGIGCHGPPYNCTDGVTNWQEAWSRQQQAWCCKHEDRGCSTTTTTLKYNCNEGYANRTRAWSVDKSAWCCEHAGMGCTTTSTTLPYNCSEGFENLQQHWSHSKRRWCCEHGDRGCTTTSTTTTEPYDCSQFVDTWKVDWSILRQQYCCKHYGLACRAKTTAVQTTTITRTTRTDTTDTSTTFTVTSTTWKRPSERATETRTTDTVTTTTLSRKRFDCLRGAENWERGWSRLKKSWCCLHEGLACTPGTQPSTTKPTTSTVAATTTTARRPPAKPMTTGDGESYCEEDFSDWQEQWSDHKKDYCCLHKNRGCMFEQATTSRPRGKSPAKTTPAPGKPRGKPWKPSLYDCSEGYGNWEQGWSPGKRVYCCLHEDKGCLTITNTHVPGPAPKPGPFHCREGVDNWQMGWSMTKKDWCCEHGKGGCGKVDSLGGKAEPELYSERGERNRQLQGPVGKLVLISDAAASPASLPALPQRQLAGGSSSLRLAGSREPAAGRAATAERFRWAALGLAAIIAVAALLVGLKKDAPRRQEDNMHGAPAPLLGRDVAAEASDLEGDHRRVE